MFRKQSDEKQQLTHQLFNAIRNSDIAEVRFALDSGADVNGKIEINGEKTTPLIRASVLNDLGIAGILLDYKADINQQTSKTLLSPLMAAVGNKCYDMVALLLESKANVNLRGKRDAQKAVGYKTALSYAVAAHYTDIELLLKRYGAEEVDPLRKATIDSIFSAPLVFEPSLRKKVSNIFSSSKVPEKTVEVPKALVDIIEQYDGSFQVRKGK